HSVLHLENTHWLRNRVICQIERQRACVVRIASVDRGEGRLSLKGILELLARGRISAGRNNTSNQLPNDDCNLVVVSSIELGQHSICGLISLDRLLIERVGIVRVEIV